VASLEPVAAPAIATPAPAPAGVVVAVPAAILPPTAPESDRGRLDRPAGGYFDGAKVLVVDDDFRNLFAMTALLERGGAVVIVAESGLDAIATLERVPDIAIVLMDIMMPVMDGYAAIHAIRMLDDFKAIPIIAVTGKVVPGERQRCIDAGANDFVPKPVDVAELLAVLKPWLPTATPSPA
jgi:CheY-like chemotaxis protein